MKLSKNQFSILEAVIEAKNIRLTQRELSDITGLSLGTVNTTLKSLEDYLNDNLINEKGLNVMEQYKVKRAVFLVAGFGSRLVPITLNTPKPLVRVKGKKIIETLLEAVEQAEIEEIIMVTGYLEENFQILLNRWPNIKFISNPIYNETNNISSAVAAKDYISGSYVLEGDLLLYNPKLIKKYQYETNYLGIKVDRTDDWCFVTDRDLITEVEIGGKDVYEMVGISYWTEKEGKQLALDLEAVFNSPGGKERYWDEVHLIYKKDNYQIKVRECTKEDVIEIDTYNELKAIDKTYI